MNRKATPASLPQAPVPLGENPVNAFHAREYAKESSPSILAVIIELTENGRDNATDVVLNIEIDKSSTEGPHHILIPKKITCDDNGTGLTHSEFLDRFCGAYSESEGHHEIDRAGRNGVGTKTYTSIADKVLVKTTTGRPTEGLDQHRNLLLPGLP
ncbi:MAG TPA: ATP-binding protein, partial [Terriglobia bacterium]|nr:ATP-binding protein [Terriglobia bacterium]